MQRNTSAQLNGVYLLFSTVDKLVLIRPFIARLHTSVVPQLSSTVVELLVSVLFKHITMHTISTQINCHLKHLTETVAAVASPTRLPVVVDDTMPTPLQRLTRFKILH